MKYSISGNIIFSTEGEAQEVFELLKLYKDKFVDINEDTEMTIEYSNIQLIENDHDIQPSKREGSKVLETIVSGGVITETKQTLLDKIRSLFQW